MVLPISLRLSITDRCQLRCRYCMPPEGVAKLNHQDLLRFEEILVFVRLLQQNLGLAKVHLTGGEPLVRPGAVELVRMLSRLHLSDLVMTTNGQQLQEQAQALKDAGLKRINVSLDTLRADRYRELTCGGDLSRVLRGINAALSAGISPIKLNTVVLRGINDDEVVELSQWALEHGVTIRFLELMPIAPASAHYQRWFVSASEVRSSLEKAFVLQPRIREKGTSSRDFIALDAQGRTGSVGFITPESQPFCQDCSRLRLTSTGRLIACLTHAAGPSIRDLLVDGSAEALAKVVSLTQQQLNQKARRSTFEASGPMPSVGG